MSVVAPSYQSINQSDRPVVAGEFPVGAPQGGGAGSPEDGLVPMTWGVPQGILCVGGDLISCAALTLSGLGPTGRRVV